jgi:ABC-type transport system substrate-binding protein
MKRIAYHFLAAISLLVATTSAATRPHYGGTLRVMMQSAPDVLEPVSNSADSTPANYWNMTRTLSLIGDTLVKLDAQGQPEPALAVSWESDAVARHWQFTLRRSVKFHDGSAASPAAIAQILGAIHPTWNVRAAAGSVTIDSETPMPSLLAELALPRNLVLKHNSSANGTVVGTGAFLVAVWQPGKLLRLAANESSWEGRPFVDAVEIHFGKSLREQAIALELDQTDLIEAVPQSGSGSGSQHHNASSSLSLPVELLALVFSPNSRAHDPRLREAVALAIDRKPIQSVLLKGAGEPAAGILPNWMTGYSALFSSQANPERARALLADSRQSAPSLTYDLSYDPRDPQAQLIAERIALNAREVGISVHVSSSGAGDIRLVRIALPSADPATSLNEVARQLGLPQPVFPASHGNGLLGNALDDLYQAERGLLDEYAVISLFHLPIASEANARVRGWEAARSGDASASGLAPAGFSLADVWLADSRSTDPRPTDSRPGTDPR